MPSGGEFRIGRTIPALSANGQRVSDQQQFHPAIDNQK